MNFVSLTPTLLSNRVAIEPGESVLVLLIGNELFSLKRRNVDTLFCFLPATSRYNLMRFKYCTAVDSLIEENFDLLALADVVRSAICYGG